MTSTLTALRRCPACGSRDLIPVVAGMETNFYCQDCSACWHVAARGADRVDPEQCPGCLIGKGACTRGNARRAERPTKTLAESGWPDIESELLFSVREAWTGFPVLPAD